jgi:hypothetical protein
MISGAVAGYTVTARSTDVVIIEARMQHPAANFLLTPCSILRGKAERVFGLPALPLGG